MSARNYTVQTKIERPVSDVFDAIVNENKICNYFVDKTSGPLTEGDRVVWSWEKWGDFPVVVRKITENRLIHLEANPKEWKKTDDDSCDDVSVFLEFESLDDGSTMLIISEQGWKTDESGLKGSHDNCSGWTHMAMCLKAWIEHGIDMR